MRAIQLTTSVAVLALAVVLVVLPCGEAGASSEDEIAAKAVVERIKDLRKAKNSADMRVAFEQLDKYHNALESKSVRHALQHVAGQVLEDEKMGAARAEAAEALAKLDDADGAYKHLKRSLPTTKTEAAGPLELTVLRAVARLAPDKAITTLVELLAKAKDNSVAKEAAIALGAFGRSKKRVQVLEAIVESLRRAKPSRAPGKRVGAATRARWSAVGRPMVSSLNRLTGRKIRDANEWLDLYKGVKRSPKKLFLEE